MKNRKIKRSYSQITRAILIRYIVAFLVMEVAFLGCYLIAWLICQQFTWQSGDPLYDILKTLQYLSPIIILVCTIAGFFVMMLLAIRKVLRYFDITIDAAKQLANPDETPIELPKEMLSVENELNLARQQAINNRRLLHEAEQRKNDLIMYLAHDLKTPLASVIGYLNLLYDEGEISPELRQRYLGISLKKAQRLEDLINEFFEIARFNLSNITLQYSTINLSLLLEQLVYEFKPMLDEKQLSCRLNVSNDIMFRCDADKIQRVFDNLLRNAVLYSFNDSEININVSFQNRHMYIRFLNHGNTIPMDKMQRIFEQFYRLDSSRSTNSGGAGLGLAIAKQIIELHGGQILARSENDIIEFVVDLPYES